MSKALNNYNKSIWNSLSGTQKEEWLEIRQCYDMGASLEGLMVMYGYGPEQLLEALECLPEGATVDTHRNVVFSNLREALEYSNDVDELEEIANYINSISDKLIAERNNA